MNRYEKLVAVRRRALYKAMKDLEEARSRLRGNCTHPEAYRTTYHWEHDTGFGIQRKMKGLKCLLCDAVNLWGSRWVDK